MKCTSASALSAAVALARSPEHCNLLSIRDRLNQGECVPEAVMSAWPRP